MSPTSFAISLVNKRNSLTCLLGYQNPMVILFLEIETVIFGAFNLNKIGCHEIRRKFCSLAAQENPTMYIDRPTHCRSKIHFVGLKKAHLNF